MLFGESEARTALELATLLPLALRLAFNEFLRVAARLPVASKPFGVFATSKELASALMLALALGSAVDMDLTAELRIPLTALVDKLEPKLAFREAEEPLTEMLVTALALSAEMAAAAVLRMVRTSSCAFGLMVAVNDTEAEEVAAMTLKTTAIKVLAIA